MQIALAVVAAIGCDESAPTPPDAPPVVAAPAPIPNQAELSTLAVLLPSKPAHLAVDKSGAVYVSQPTDTGRDLVLKLGARETLETTALTSATIAQALGDVELKGNINALCAGPDGHLYFFYASTTGRRSEFALGQYHTRTAIVRILADSAALLSASGLGASMELATPRLAATDSAVYLSLATIDQHVMLRIEPRQLIRPGPAELTRPFERILHGAEELSLTPPVNRLSGGFGASLFLVDAYSGGLFQVDPKGHAKMLSTLVGLPHLLSPAMTLPEDRVMLFAADGEEIIPKVESRTDAASVDTLFPAILIFDKGKISAIPKERIAARPALPVYALRLRNIVAEPGGTFIAFDAASGELMRLRLWFKP